MKWLNRQSKTILGASITLAVFGLLSRFIGLIRDRILASRFGASDILDVYYVSFNIPDFIFNLLVIGAVSSAFIPIFIEYQLKKNGQEWKIANNFLNLLMIVVAGAIAILFFFVPLLMNIIAPGFTAEKKELAVLFTRVMLLSPFIFSISVVMGSVLQAFHRFLIYSFAPVMYNIGIIIGVVFFEPKFGPLGLAEGVVLGAFLHLLIQIPAAYKVGFRWQKIIDLTSSGMKRIFLLMIPRSIGLAAMQINWIVLSALATTLSIGSVAIFNFANNLQYLPISLVGISIAVASFPTLSREAIEKSREDFAKRIMATLRKIIFIIIPLSFLAVYLREDIVRVVLGAGKFQIDDISLTAQVFGFFTIGIFAQSIIPFLSRSFYALQNTKIPVISTLISIIVNIGLAFMLINRGFDILSLPLAFSVAGILNLVLLLYFINRRLKFFNIRQLIQYSWKILLLSYAMILFITIIDGMFIYKVLSPTFSGAFYHGLLVAVLAALTFMDMSFMLKIKEVSIFKIRRKNEMS